ncbi:MAG: hypothetical protein AB8B68_04755 [Rickettsiaceae bacterium]
MSKSFLATNCKIVRHPKEWVIKAKSVNSFVIVVSQEFDSFPHDRISMAYININGFCAKSFNMIEPVKIIGMSDEFEG